MAFRTVRVEGESMLPALRPGDLLLVRRDGRVTPGDLVIAHPLVRRDLLVVKRARLDLGDGDWDVTADNPDVFGRGWTSGPAQVVGRVVLRWWPPVRRS